MNNKRRGSDGERELAKELQKYGFDTHRGCQFKGGYDSPDVYGLPGIHIECKRYKKIPSYQMMEDFLNQAERDAEGKALPAVFHRLDRHGWKVTMRLCYFVSLFHTNTASRGIVTMALDDWMNIYGGIKG